MLLPNLRASQTSSNRAISINKISRTMSTVPCSTSTLLFRLNYIRVCILRRDLEDSNISQVRNPQHLVMWEARTSAVPLHRCSWRLAWSMERAGLCIWETFHRRLRLRKFWAMSGAVRSNQCAFCLTRIALSFPSLMVALPPISTPTPS